MFTSGDIGKVVSFDVYPANIIGTVFDHVKFLALLDAESAYQYIDPASMHASIYPTLPVGSPANYDGYLYAKLRLPSGETTCLGLPWIIDSSIVFEENLSFTVKVTDVSSSDYTRLRTALIANGFTSIEIIANN